MRRMIVTGQRGRNMAIRTKLVAGNWKMNGLREDGTALARALAHRAAAGGELRLRAARLPAGDLAERGWRLRSPGAALRSAGRIATPLAKGAFTGDISAEMLADLGCTHVILGPFRAAPESWRNRWRRSRQDRAAHGEPVLSRSSASAKRRQQRQSGSAVEVVAAQLAGSIPDGAGAGHVSSSLMSRSGPSAPG